GARAHFCTPLHSSNRYSSHLATEDHALMTIWLLPTCANWLQANLDGPWTHGFAPDRHGIEQAPLAAWRAVRAYEESDMIGHLFERLREGREVVRAPASLLDIVEADDAEIIRDTQT